MSKSEFPVQVSPVQIVRARIENAAELTQIARASKRHWGYPAEWMEAWSTSLTITPESIRKYDYYAAALNGTPVGFYGLVPDDDVIRLEHLWVLPNSMKRGVGRALFTHAAALSWAQDFSEMEIASDPNAAGFYEHLGCKRTGSVLSEICGERREIPILAYSLVKQFKSGD